MLHGLHWREPAQRAKNPDKEKVMGVIPDGFIQERMQHGGRYVAARLQSALALLERLRGDPSLDLADHLSGKGSSGIKGHESFGQAAHDRWQIEPQNKNHGRRSSNLQDWGQDLLGALAAAGFSDGGEQDREKLLTEAQRPFVEALRH